MNLLLQFSNRIGMNFEATFLLPFFAIGFKRLEITFIQRLHSYPLQ